MPLREAYEYYGTSRGAVANYVNGFAVQSRAYTMTFDSLRSAERIAVPTLMVHSENALAPALARRFFSGLTCPHDEVWLPSQGQIDFYDDPWLVGAATDDVRGLPRAVCWRRPGQWAHLPRESRFRPRR